ncbi:beta-galactosidase, partial [bacterium]|nr:beta-galactosidase [bacterium]
MRRLPWCFLAPLLFATPVFGLQNPETSRSLIRFDRNFDAEALPARDVKPSLVKKGPWLRLESGHSVDWPGVTFKGPEGGWDLSNFREIGFPVRNVGANRVEVVLRVDNPGADGVQNCVTSSVELEAGDATTMTVVLTSSGTAIHPPQKIIGMKGSPVGMADLDPREIVQIIVFVPKPSEDHVFEIGEIEARGAVRRMAAGDFFPFIDEFGQYVHKDWPGKTHSLEEMKEADAAEVRDLEANPGPVDRNQYGGWAAGPQLEATGAFRPVKHEGRWWLADPEGRLFWSHGIDCITRWETTPIDDRKDYFRFLPESGTPLADFYGENSWAPHGYYKDHIPHRTYDFAGANLFRKFGTDWQERFIDRSHRRVRSWGLNTIGNWSQSEVYLKSRTPYVVPVSTSGRAIEGSSGFWGKFPDPFTPEFSENIRKRMEKQKGKTTEDPWCIGYFVDNEMSWGNDRRSLAEAALVSPADQPAKLVFIEDLKKKYSTVDDLNKAWGVEFASWEAILENTEIPENLKKAYPDLEAFYTRIAKTYFEKVRQAVKEAAPDRLYLGCRFAL